MDKFTQIVNSINDFVWGPVMLLFLVGTGIFLTIRLKFIPWKNLGSSLKKLFSKESRQKDGEGDISPFSALMTALAATVGTGNIVGVATAMVLGGPGALVWMWISAAFGISTNMQNVRLPASTEPLMKKVKCAAGRCIRSNTVLRTKNSARFLQ